MILLIHWLAAMVVLAEALNKLERTSPLAPGLTWGARRLEWHKALAWAMLAIGAGSGVAAPIIGDLDPALFRHAKASTPETFIMLGVAALIVYTRAKEPRNERRTSI